MTSEKIKEQKKFYSTINPELDKLEDVPMFEEKIAQLHEIVEMYGLPTKDKDGNIKIIYPLGKKKRKKRANAATPPPVSQNM